MYVRSTLWEVVLLDPLTCRARSPSSLMPEPSMRLRWMVLLACVEMFFVTSRAAAMLPTSIPERTLQKKTHIVHVHTVVVHCTCRYRILTGGYSEWVK